MRDNCIYNVLIASEDEDFSRQLEEALGEFSIQGYKAAGARDFYSLLEYQPYDLLLLDRDLGEEDGLVVLRRLRQHQDLPVFVLSGDQDCRSQLAVLEMGADDCIGKPVSPDLVAAKTRNFLKRIGFRDHGSKPSAQRWHFSGWTLDATTRMVTGTEGKSIKLTRAEFDLLHALLHAEGQPLSKMQLADAVSKGSVQASVDTIAVLVHRLRRKLGGKDVIQTFSGVGYRICTT
ncbi:response regulator transcription factor [Marinospirillum alkaliphilum]|uniref:Two-component system, OmpR family, response regulator n=1 Tax=Marinospirillum alkaliphilum DSM 21637 TaxID=1122209 RepID=A0A1K1TWS0_9GAMM|nr:response regulator transcription factor [Marinospirillum alkaliphilum]SFX04922.1 two-component system, OmpR family, response regulator [Marinospirillum alkaliphilum DSM 21637]